jgi:hypothetical protein
VRAKAPVLVVAALAAGVLTGCRFTSVKDSPVSLSSVRDAVVVNGSGSRPAADGQRLAKGDRVRTGSDGAATLVVRDRRVVLGASTEVAVPDGATVELARGALLVDHRRGPGLTVRAGDTTVDQVGTGALRVERSFSVLVASLSAPARVRSATGPRLSLPALYQVTAAGRALPRDAAPLHLRHDGWERDVVRSLVAEDDRLNSLAAALDGPGAVVPASYRPSGGGQASDLVLADAIDRAAGSKRARDLRAQGGSWAVVAHLSGTSAVNVSRALADVLNNVTASTPQPSTAPSPVVAGRTPEPVASGSPSPRPSGSREPGPRPSTTPPPTSSSPSPSAGLTDFIKNVLPSPSIGIPLP